MLDALLKTKQDGFPMVVLFTGNTKDYRLADQCFGQELVPTTLNAPPKAVATLEDYYEVARVRTEEVLIFSHKYETARKCVGEFK